jgi:hypothetical protein
MDNILYIVILIVVSFDFTELGAFHLLSLSVQPVTDLLLLTVHPVPQPLLQSRLPGLNFLTACTVGLHLLFLLGYICDHTLSKE